MAEKLGQWGVRLFSSSLWTVIGQTSFHLEKFCLYSWGFALYNISHFFVWFCFFNEAIVGTWLFFLTGENKIILIVWENTGEDAFSCSIPYTQTQVLPPLTVVVSDAEPSSCPSLAPCFSFASVLCQLPNAVLCQPSIPGLLALPLLFFFLSWLPPLPPLPSSVAKFLFLTECQRHSGEF